MRLSLGKTVVFLSTILSLALLTGCSLGTAEMEKTDIDVLSEKSSKSWEQAETTPLGKYPELVTYTLGQMKGASAIGTHPRAITASGMIGCVSGIPAIAKDVA